MFYLMRPLHLYHQALHRQSPYLSIDQSVGDIFVMERRCQTSETKQHQAPYLSLYSLIIWRNQVLVVWYSDSVHEVHVHEASKYGDPSRSNVNYRSRMAALDWPHQRGYGRVITIRSATAGRLVLIVCVFLTELDQVWTGHLTGSR